jgi:hypothetical protein
LVNTETVVKEVSALIVVTILQSVRRDWGKSKTSQPEWLVSQLIFKQKACKLEVRNIAMLLV